METKSQNHWCVYIHTNKINNKVYIGMTGNNPSTRWGKEGNGYKGSPYFWRAIQKYGWGNFNHIIFEDKITKDRACKLEKILIALYKANNQEYGYNLSSGGDGGATGVPWSDERKENLSKKLKGRVFTEDWKEKIKQSKTGTHATEETKRKLSEQRRGELNNFYGKHHSDETKKIMSDKAKQRDKATINTDGLKHGKEHWTSETYIKLSNSKLGEKSPTSKLKEEDVINILKMIQQGITYKEIKKKYPIADSEISRIKHKKRWGYLYDKLPELYV